MLQAASSYASNTLSSLYFDVVKDTLYCDAVTSPQRQAIIATMQHVSASPFLERFIAATTFLIPPDFVDSAAASSRHSRRPGHPAFSDVAFGAHTASMLSLCMAQ